MDHHAPWSLTRHPVHRNPAGGTRWHNSPGRATKRIGVPEGVAMVARTHAGNDCCAGSACSDTLPAER